MLAGILVVTVIAELVVSVWCLTRWVGVRRELQIMEKHYDALSDALRDFAKSGGAPVDVPEVEASALGDAAKVLADAKPEDVAAAMSMLGKLGIGPKE